MKLLKQVLPLLLLPVASSAGTLSWDSFTLFVDSFSSPTNATVDVVNLHWTGEDPVPISAQLQDFSYATTLYFFTGVQQLADGTVVPNEQAFVTFDPALAAEILGDYQEGSLYIGLYSGPTFIDGIFAGPNNSTLATPEPWQAWPVAFALAAFAFRRKLAQLRRS